MKPLTDAMSGSAEIQGHSSCELEVGSKVMVEVVRRTVLSCWQKDLGKGDPLWLFPTCDPFCDVADGGCPVLQIGLFRACTCLEHIYLGFLCTAGGPEPVGLSFLRMAEAKTMALCEVVKLPQCVLHS